MERGRRGGKEEGGEESLKFLRLGFCLNNNKNLLDEKMGRVREGRW